MIARFTSRTLEGVAVLMGWGDIWRFTLLAIGGTERILASVLASGRDSFPPREAADQHAQSCAPDVDQNVPKSGISIGEKRLQVFTTTADEKPEREYTGSFVSRLQHRSEEQDCQNSEESEVKPFVCGEV